MRYLGRRLACDSMVVSSIPGRLSSGGHTTSVCNQPPCRPTQPPLSVGREMNTGQSALMCCGWGVKTGWLIPFVDKRVGVR